MDSTDPHTKAARAMRSEISRAIRGLVAQLERASRAQLRIPAQRVEGREQQAMAEAIRDQAKRTGWL